MVVYYEPLCSFLLDGLLGDLFENLFENALVVTIVVYGTSEDVQDYWLVKTSWGTNWGMYDDVSNKDNPVQYCLLCVLSCWLEVSPGAMPTKKNIDETHWTNLSQS